MVCARFKKKLRRACFFFEVIHDDSSTCEGALGLKSPPEFKKKSATVHGNRTVFFFSVCNPISENLR